MTPSRRVADPRFATPTLAVDLPSLVDSRREASTLADREAAVERAWEASATRRVSVPDALGLAESDVPVESVPTGELDANGREPAARTLVTRLAGTDRWGVLTDGRYWRLYGGGDPDEQRFHELDLRALLAGDGGSASTRGRRRFVALFAREAFEGDADEEDANGGDAESFLDALASADAARRASVRASLGDRFVTAVETLRAAPDGPSDGASVAVAFRLAFDLFAADRTGTPRFVADADALRAVRDRLAAAPTADESAGGGPTLDSTGSETLREWVAGAADSALGGPFGTGPSADAAGASPDDSASSPTGVGDPSSAADVRSLTDETLERVCSLLGTVSCDGRRFGVDYRTVDARHLADVHERLVDAFERSAGGRTTRRKAHGSFYTPDSVVTYLAARTAGSLADDARDDAADEAGDAFVAAVRSSLLDARVADPAMGGGTLLVAVARRLASGIRRAAREAGAPVEPVASVRRAVVERCLYGVDRSPTAAAVARLVCLVETLGPEADVDRLPALADHLRCGDALLGPGPDADDADPAAGTAADRPGAIRWRTAFAEVFDAENSGRGGVGFDAIVGNPPWKGTAGRADISARIDGDTTAHLKRTFEAAAGPQPNLYAAFLERACRLAPGGRVALVVPDALLVRLSAAPARRFLIDAGGVTHLLRVGTVFADANEGAAVVVCAPETDTGADATGKNAIRTWFGDAEAFAVAARADSFEYGRLSRETVASEAYARFQLLRDDVAEGIFRKLERRDPLEAVGSVARGEEFGKRDDSVHEVPADGTRPLVPGSAVRPYALRRGEIRHVDAEAVSKAVYDPPKLLCRQTGRFLVGTLDVEGLANLKSVYDVHVDPVHRSAGPADDERLLKHLLGLLNSRVYNYYHYVRRNAYPAQFPQQNQRNYETLPVWSGSVDDELVSLVDRRLAVGRERASLADDVASVVEFEDASVPLDRFDPEVVDDGLSRSHRAETPGLRIADLSVREAGDELTLRATYETDAGRETRDVLRFAAPSPRDAVVLSTWLPAVGAATATDRRACGLRPVGRSSQTTPATRLRALRVPDPETHAAAVARCARDRRRAATLDRRAATLDARIDARVADACGLTADERRRVRETLASVSEWTALRRPSG
ncbi:hypothetical protein SAMN04487947_4064 [Halogeometricum rufum]|uniref:site-specific DNA-methyltransferase (adenine-specific) n=1 Tax=Halogeometricum rufum TaxID=553469 RepID=A0A1I6J590_9EURY|nr:N-6 DNA methylase [Halogeometricum rufum]SFR74153.1 hypothetical protein SAMN04487947_4064 [Halogeometricum rufum]